MYYIIMCQFKMPFSSKRLVLTLSLSTSSTSGFFFYWHISARFLFSVGCEMSNDLTLCWHLLSVLKPKKFQATSNTLTGESESMSPAPGQETNVSVQQPQWRAPPKEIPSKKIKCITLHTQRGKAVTYIYFMSPQLFYSHL